MAMPGLEALKRGLARLLGVVIVGYVGKTELLTQSCHSWVNKCLIDEDSWLRLCV